MRKAEDLLNLALMASARRNYHEALTYIERAQGVYLSLALSDERDQMRREMAISDLRNLRENGL